MTEVAKSRVIVVDDDQIVADTVALVLRHAGFEVYTFYDALTAAQHALKSHPQVVVTDYAMPNIDGLELAAWMKYNCPGCKIVILSGKASMLARQADDGPKFTLIQKPVHTHTLVAAVWKQISG
jgi:DNA-binding NtrC family response regulator